MRAEAAEREAGFAKILDGLRAFTRESRGDFFSGDVWTTNVVVAMVTGLASTVLYTMGESGFDTTQLTAALWLGSLALKLKAGPWERFVLSVQKPGEPTTTPLPAETTLQAVVDAHAVEANSLELFFRFRILGYD